jgi:hypothetical protein
VTQGNLLKKTDSPDPIVTPARTATCDMCGSPLLEATVTESLQIKIADKFIYVIRKYS